MKPTTSGLRSQNLTRFNTKDFWKNRQNLELMYGLHFKLFMVTSSGKHSMT